MKVRDNGWEVMKANFLLNDDYSQYAKAGAWNDPDLLHIGLNKLTPTEERTQFTLWCLAKAPLLISAPLS